MNRREYPSVIFPNELPFSEYSLSVRENRVFDLILASDDISLTDAYKSLVYGKAEMRSEVTYKDVERAFENKTDRSVFVSYEDITKTVYRQVRRNPKLEDVQRELSNLFKESFYIRHRHLTGEAEYRKELQSLLKDLKNKKYSTKDYDARRKRVKELRCHLEDKELISVFESVATTDGGFNFYFSKSFMPYAIDLWAFKSYPLEWSENFKKSYSTQLLKMFVYHLGSNKSKEPLRLPIDSLLAYFKLDREDGKGYLKNKGDFLRHVVRPALKEICTHTPLKISEEREMEKKGGKGRPSLSALKFHIENTEDVVRALRTTGEIRVQEVDSLISQADFYERYEPCYDDII